MIFVYRSYTLLLFTSTFNVLVVSYPDNFLGTKISFPSQKLSDNSSYKIPAHCLCHNMHIESSHSRACYHDQVLTWKIFQRSSEGRSWIYYCSFSTDFVSWKGQGHSVLHPHSTHCHLIDRWNNSPHLHLLDHSQSRYRTLAT